MKAKATIFLRPGMVAGLGAILLVSCGKHVETVDNRTVRGVLQHFPQDVKSVEAWLGSEFVVDGTPIRPTEAVPAEKLLDLVGKTVTIEGTWNPGEERKPGPEEQQLSTPVFPEGEVPVVGSGIEATAVREAEK